MFFQTQTKKTDRKRWRFQFSLRTLMLATVATAGLMGMWMLYLHPYFRDQQIAQHVVDIKGNVTFESRGPEWLISLVGDHYFQRLVSVRIRDRPISNADLEPLGRASYLQTIELIKTPQISDRGIRHFANLLDLRTLNVTSRKLTAQSTQHLINLRNLEELTLYSAEIGGESLAPLANMHKLRRVMLPNISPNDPGLLHLCELENLEYLFLRRMILQGDGIQFFQERRRMLAADPTSSPS